MRFKQIKRFIIWLFFHKISDDDFWELDEEYHITWEKDEI